MTLILALVLLLGAVAILGRGLVKEAPSTGLARSLATLEQSAPGSQEPAEDEAPFADRVLAPLQARALQVGRRMTGADKADRIRHKLDLAGNPLDWSVDRVVGLKVLAAVLLPACGVAYGVMVGASALTLLLIVAVAGAVGFFAPDLYLYQRAYERSEAIRRTLADSVDLLTISVEAGLGFDAALQQVARNTGGPLADEFSRVLREIQLGKGRSDSLKALGERTNIADLKSFVGAMVQADAFGISIAQVLRVQTSEIRVKRRQYAEAKAQQVPVKIMVPLVVCILPCLMAVIMGPAIISMLKAFS
ncbi:type II secretion system F family protein [Nocardioides bizhenqiangii]|uniref:Type II secretion system F family protein n=1 Tax=Nocardioides bizhenqiangii TaxID=3095076 RepID=A0ABZ0ZN78_9ACTN|nr:MULTISPECIES: type II secretion system F family protein [unclassified Nocardioides]MDZ5620701.1 type II secretion system F family protein [Nocardioides sp. HM23]WQQ25067.1 type II secretion system F family protein [Nocardioides sp. HM61]